MTASEIVKQVRLCIDEEGLGDDYVTQSMDNIIRGKAGDALRWCCLNAEASLLYGSDTSGSSSINVAIQDVGTDMPEGFVKVIRVKGNDWHRAVLNPVEEDSEEYLMAHDEIAGATKERPQAAIIRSASPKVEAFPSGSNVTCTVVVCPDSELGTGEAASIAIPPRVKGAFIYYLAFLVLSAYGDSRAQTMLGIAKMELGIQQ